MTFQTECNNGFTIQTKREETQKGGDREEEEIQEGLDEEETQGDYRSRSGTDR